MCRSQLFGLVFVFVGAASAASNLLADSMDAFADYDITNDSGETEHEFNLVFAGNDTSTITSSGNEITGAFVTVEFSSASDTTTLSYDDEGGGSGLAPGASGNASYGFTGSGNAIMGTGALDAIGAYWGTDPTMNQIPALTTAINATGGGPGQEYLILYASIQQGVSDVISQVSEYLVNVGASIQALLENGSSSNIVPNDNGPMFSFNVGFQFSNTQIPLDDLNTTYYPPSSFTPLSGVPDGTPIAPNGYAATDAFVVPQPEPSSIVLLGFGAMALAAMARRRTRRMPPT